MVNGVIRKEINGRIIEYDIGNHTYFLDGKFAPSVTTILSQFGKGDGLLRWAVNSSIEVIDRKLSEVLTGVAPPLTEETKASMLQEAKEKPWQLKDSAASIGNLTHRAIEKDLKGKKAILTPNIKTPFNSYKVWKNSFKTFRPIASEILTFSDSDCMYAGTADFIIELNGRAMLGDIKTTTSIRESFILQLSGYRHALVENNGFDIDGMGILRLEKVSGYPTWYEFSNIMYNEGYKSFCHLCNLWHSQEKLKILKRTNILKYD